MRIISKTRDYYDAAQAQGQDRSLVFLREFSESSPDQRLGDHPAALLPFRNHAFAVSPGNIQLPRNPALYDVASVAPGFVLFAGKLYPFAQVYASRWGITGRPTASSVDRVCYDMADFIQTMSTLEYDVEAHNKFKHHLFKPDRVGSWSAFFEMKGNTRMEAFAVEQRKPVLSWCRAGDHLQVNPSLAQLQFFRVFDAWQAFQELSMFMGNLANPDNNQVVIADKHRIAQHGFDEYSFRKLPQGR